MLLFRAKKYMRKIEKNIAVKKKILNFAHKF
jgi:hypothetical protein